MPLYQKWEVMRSSRDRLLRESRSKPFDEAQVLNEQAGALTQEMVELEKAICATHNDSLSAIRAKLRISLACAEGQADMDGVCMMSWKLIESALRDLDAMTSVGA